MIKLICSICGRDLNEIWQDNVSPSLDFVICEDCEKRLRCSEGNSVVDNIIEGVFDDIKIGRRDKYNERC